MCVWMEMVILCLGIGITYVFSFLLGAQTFRILSTQPQVGTK